MSKAPTRILKDVGLNPHERRSQKGWIARVPRVYVETGQPLALFSSPWFCCGEPKVFERPWGFYVLGFDGGFDRVHLSAPKGLQDAKGYEEEEDNVES